MKKEISALEAKIEAQKIAFAPIVFQATIALKKLGILALIAKHRKGIQIKEVAEQLKLSEYGVATLLEMAECANIVEYLDVHTVKLTSIGYVLNTDRMTEVNLNFVDDVCYEGAKFTTESIANGKPEGLKVFGKWPTVYEGLASLPDIVKKSWFEFDHYYSDAAFPAALKIVFKDKPKLLFDIGGNTGKWALACCAHDKDVRIKILDLPGQLAVAKKNAEEKGVDSRIDFHQINLLDTTQKIPQGADVIWMSQFLDCFSESEIVQILRNVKQASTSKTQIYIMETFIDNQKFDAASYCLTGTSLYFTTIANGNSKMYRKSTMEHLVVEAGLKVIEEFELIDNSHHTILKCQIA